MFEDIIHDGRNLVEEIREYVSEQVKRGIEISVDRGGEDWIVALCEEEMTKNFDRIVQMYTDYFTPAEIAEILDWSKSDLALRTTKFNDKIMTPFILEFFNTVMKKVFERDAKLMYEEPAGEA